MDASEIPVWEPLIKRSILFADLPQDVLHQVARKMEVESRPKGTVLFQAGDAADRFYLIASGQVKVMSVFEGKEKLNAHMGRGDTLGEISLLTGEPRAYTVRLETSCEFLALSKKDFEAFLKKFPTILVHVSRLLSKRLFLASQSREDASTLTPQVLGLVPGLGPRDRALFVSHLAMALLEQTRRRVMVVELTPDAGFLAKAFGIEPLIVDPERIRGGDLHDPGMLDDLATEHGSGLTLMSVPPKTLSGPLLRASFLFLNLLRESFDFVLLVLGEEPGEVEKAVLAESDKWLWIGRSSESARFDKLETRYRTALTELKFSTRILLDDGNDPGGSLGYDAGVVKVPWTDAFRAPFEKGERLFERLPPMSTTLVAIERLARRLGLLKVGLAMGSGAALGYSLIGVLKTFAKHRIPVDLMAGSSMGSIVGALYAMGMDPLEIQREALKIDKAWVYENVVWDLGIPRSGFLGGTTLHRYLKSLFGDLEFSDLEVPFQAVATDIQTGEPVYLREGKVADAVRASCGIPIVVQPFFHQGRFLVDGGVVDPVPVHAVSKMGADLVLAVNLTKSPEQRRVAKMSKRREILAKVSPLEGPNLWEILFRTLFTMQYEIANRQEDFPHVMIQPDNKHFHWTELYRAGELIENGEAAAEDAIGKVKALLPYFSNFCRMPLRKVDWRAR